MIVYLWETLDEFWKAHLAARHGDTVSPATVPEYQRLIRALHSEQRNVLARDRSRYFHDDLNGWFERASLSQLKQYVITYQPLILLSKRQAATIATSGPTLESFPDFTTTRSRPTTPTPIPEEIKRKHSRWRPLQAVIDKFRSFFTTPTPQS